MLGQLIADVTGLPFAHAAEELVLEPLGMRDSQFPAKAADIAPNAVTGYTLTPDGAFEALPGAGVHRAGDRRALVHRGGPGPAGHRDGRRCCPRR